MSYVIPGAPICNKQNIVRLFRQLLKAGDRMPTENRRFFVKNKVRTEFRLNMEESDPEKIYLLFRIGHTQLDTINIQADHLRKFYQDDREPVQSEPDAPPSDQYKHQQFEDDILLQQQQQR